MVVGKPHPYRVATSCPARFKVSEQSVALKVEFSAEKTAPPPKRAKFEVIVQSVVLTVALSITEIAPPDEAEFEVIVQPVVVTVEDPPALTTPPISAVFEVIVQFVAMMLLFDSKPVYIAPPCVAAFEEI
jgi:hypothetical protein